VVVYLAINYLNYNYHSNSSLLSVERALKTDLLTILTVYELPSISSYACAKVEAKWRQWDFFCKT